MAAAVDTSWRPKRVRARSSAWSSRRARWSTTLPGPAVAARPERQLHLVRQRRTQLRQRDPEQAQPRTLGPAVVWRLGQFGGQEVVGHVEDRRGGVGGRAEGAAP